MNLDIKCVHSEANQWTVKKAIASVLHSPSFRKSSDPDERLINFQVLLNESALGGVRNNGTGVLTLPSHKLGREFFHFVIKNPVAIDGKRLKFFLTDNPVPLPLVMRLEKTPYINPDQEEERLQKLHDLKPRLRVDQVQFGVFYRSYPKIPTGKAPPRAFSIECALDYSKTSLGWLRFDYDRKLIRIELGDETTEQIGKCILIQFSSISKLAVGYDGNPFICFDISTPPILEEIDFNRPITGNEAEDTKKSRRRIGCLHPDHGIVAPYAHQLRIILFHDRNVDMVGKFISLCDIAGLQSPLNCDKHKISIDAGRRGFFKTNKIHSVRNWLKGLDWYVAFQLEALLRNARLNTEDLLGDLRAPIAQLCQEYPDTARDVLCHFNEALDDRPLHESPVECFKRIRDRELLTQRPPLYSGFIYCHHVTFTPTRLILEGPFATQSNRVIRLYAGYEHNFLRVDFREEDRLQYRSNREVDTTSFLNERVGGILKDGFELAGRNFEFLAYSTSALREHAVWFMHPFQHHRIDETGQVQDTWVTSDSIRASLGDFSQVLNQPSKYAARMAQAFTATDPSVKIRRDEWEMIPDMGKFTDGVGTISRELSDSIWGVQCASRPDHGERAIKPDVYQIRFLGFKGVVGVDERLEGRKMCLRESMKKFDSKRGDADAPIEIARAFEYPNQAYLNRAMVMVLEDRGVRKEVFLDLQQSAIAEVKMIDHSITQFRQILKTHGLGHQFGLNRIMERLNSLGLDLTNYNGATVINDPFLTRLRRVTMNHILRDIKHRARIPVPDSYQLVGVADEGPAYQAKGLENVFILTEGQIYACIQNPGDPEPTWLRGKCMISRNPVVHPGDVQCVYAIGKPPADKICLFGHMKNVVVFSSVGLRPLPSCLSGGDLDGDTFDIVQYPLLLPPIHIVACTYDDHVEILSLDRDSTVADICDFIVDYIRSDVLGLLATRHLVIADQSKKGTLDRDCLTLVGLCSQAVDYPKNGIPVSLDGNRIPRSLIYEKPDWQSAEVVAPRQLDYYTSHRALGYLYRSIELDDPSMIPSFGEQGPVNDVISIALKPHVESKLLRDVGLSGDSGEIEQLFQKYVNELRYICASNTLSSDPGVRLLEEEVVVGTILAKCAEQRLRRGRIYRMQQQASVLVRNIQRDLEGDWDISVLPRSLCRAWFAWDFSVRNKGTFGSNSFGLIALGAIFSLLDKLDKWNELKVML